MQKLIHSEEWSKKTLEELLGSMRFQGLLFKEITLEFRKNNKTVLVSATGKETAGLSHNYFDKIEDQLKHVHNSIFKDFVNFAQTNVEVTIKVKENGNFDLNNIELLLHMDVVRGTNAEEALRKPLRKFLPFLEHITELDARGYNFELTVLHCKMELSEEDFYIVMEDPSIVSPRARKEWFLFGSVLYSKAQDSYSFSVTIPCYQGELVWDNKDVTIKHTIRKTS